MQVPAGSLPTLLQYVPVQLLCPNDWEMREHNSQLRLVPDVAFVCTSPNEFVHALPSCLYSVCLKLPPHLLPSWEMEGWKHGLGLQECRQRMCGAALSLRRLFCQPGATDQQSSSQPCSDLIPLSLYLTLFSAKGTYCPHVSFLRQPPVLLPMGHVCLATSPSPSPLSLSLFLLPTLSLSLFFPQSSCLSTFVSVHGCLPVHLPVCLPATLSNTSLAQRSQAVSHFANLPSYVVYWSSVCVFILACLPVCVLSACLASKNGKHGPLAYSKVASAPFNLWTWQEKMMGVITAWRFNT